MEVQQGPEKGIIDQSKIDSKKRRDESSLRQARNALGLIASIAVVAGVFAVTNVFNSSRNNQEDVNTNKPVPQLREEDTLNLQIEHFNASPLVPIHSDFGL